MAQAALRVWCVLVRVLITHSTYLYCLPCLLALFHTGVCSDLTLLEAMCICMPSLQEWCGFSCFVCGVFPHCACLVGAGDTALIVRTAELLLQTEYEGVDLQVVHASVISLLSAVGKLRWAIKNYDMCDMLAVLASRLSCPEVDQALISTVQASMKESVSVRAVFTVLA